jgi:membrane-bound serine protease (ClpP class)
MKDMRQRTIWLGILLLVVLVPPAAGAGDQVKVLEIEGPVTPIMLSYIERGIEAAESDGSEALVIQLDTPGGDVGLMLKIMQAITNARVPVVVYVAPTGAMAASAGTLITLAGHAAAMAPGTTIGAASPVGAQGEDLGETIMAKEVEMLKASARQLAKRRGEEATAWAEAAIEEAKAATAEEALEIGVIDLIARDLNELLAGLDGLTVTVAGEEVTLATEGLAINPLPMTAIEQLLHLITNPTIAFILLTLGLNAILFELSSPGGYAAGIVGAICLLLGFYALGVLPVNYAGLLLIALAFVFFVLEVKAPTHGLLTVGGVVALVLGALVLFNSPLYRVSTSVIVTVALASGGFFAFIVTKAVRIQTHRATTGSEGLVGRVGTARTDLSPEGTVFVWGEYWAATAEVGTIRAGQQVEVVGKEGFRLRVRRVV